MLLGHTTAFWQALRKAPRPAVSLPQVILRPPTPRGNLSSIGVPSSIPEEAIEPSNWAYLQGDLAPGAPVEVVAPHNDVGNLKPIGLGFFEVQSRCVRMFDHNRRPLNSEPAPPVNANYWIERVQTAHRLRVDSGVTYRANNCYRLLNGDADGTPGMSADVYGKVCRVVLTADGPTHGPMHALHDVMTTKLGQVGHYWVEYRPPASSHVSRMTGWIAEVEPRSNDYGLLENASVQATMLSTEPHSTTGGPLDNRMRGVRAAIQVASADKDVLDVWGGAGYTMAASLAGKPRSLTVAEDRPSPLHFLQQTTRQTGPVDPRLSVLTDNVRDTLASLDTGGFDVVVLTIPKAHPTLVEDLRHALRIITLHGYLFMLLPWGNQSEALSSIQEACDALRRPCTVVRSFYAGPDYPWLVGERHPGEVAFMLRVE